MGLLVDGKWTSRWYDTRESDGAFEREAAQLRNWVTPDGRAGPSGTTGFPAESGRYHLYVSLACPWAHRTLIFRKLKQLSDHVSVSVVSPDMLEHGWTFSCDQGGTVDHLYGLECLHQLYTTDRPQYSGRVTVPVLWDRQRKCIVNNESSEIIRMLNSSFNGLTGNPDDYYPESLRSEIDTVNSRVYEDINNGVYRTGFATTQAAYETAYRALFDALDWAESRLSRQRYLAGNRITEADWRLFTTLIRFDAVYHGHFKCNRQRLEDYPNLAGHTRELYQWPGIAETVSFHHIKRHYYFSHFMINPTQVVPAGPDIDYSTPHRRDRLATDV
ncbi:MAG: glutathione S-transferase family protein [Gammaproteobacteria bacterium]|nr:glutathione S-transferase family protein [Gammaproteobacteria bacterium]MYD75760.1 glutathione S-transferase family protein [Gammaproteobacteria bacterium]